MYNAVNMETKYTITLLEIQKIFQIWENNLTDEEMENFSEFMENYEKIGSLKDAKQFISYLDQVQNGTKNTESNEN